PNARLGALYASTTVPYALSGEPAGWVDPAVGDDRRATAAIWLDRCCRMASRIRPRCPPPAAFRAPTRRLHPRAAAIRARRGRIVGGRGWRPGDRTDDTYQYAERRPIAE